MHRHGLRWRKSDFYSFNISFKKILKVKSSNFWNFNFNFQYPTKGDWASSCVQDLKDLEIQLSVDDIKSLPKNQFCKMLKESIKVKALHYLLKKQKSKGQEIEYSELKMAEYLMPNFQNISIEDRRNIFELRNRMLPIPINFPNRKDDTTCWCGDLEETRHIYICK